VPARAASRMRRAVRFLCAAALLLACQSAQSAPPPGEPQLRALSAEQRARLERDRLVMLPSDAAEPGVAHGLVFFSQPSEAVWHLLTQTERQREYRPELTELTNVERAGNVAVDRNRISVMFIRLAYHLRYEWDPKAWRIAWSLAPGYDNDMQQVSGTWSLFELGGGRTLGRLASSVVVGSAVPRSMQEALTRKKVPELLDHVRRWVDSGGTWRP
jgi:hypothetical protein